MSIAMWPFASALLTLPVLALIYHRYHRLRLSSALSSYLVILYLLSLVFFTLWPMPDDRASFCATHYFPAQLHPLQFLEDLATGGRTALFQIVLNIIFFIPLGFIMGRVFRWRFYAAIPIAFLTSLTIETAQLTGAFGLVGCAYRHFDVDDLVWNTSGAIVGIICAAIINWISPPRQADADEVVLNPSFLHRSVAMAVDLVLTYAISSSLGFALVVIINRMAYHQANGNYSIHGISVNPSSLRIMVVALNVFFLLVFELVLPLMRHGQTLGGSFTHMSIETRSRHGWLRTIFYFSRTVLVVFIFGPWSGNIRQIANALAVLLLVFYLFKRQMPYDCIPASRIYDSPGNNSSQMYSGQAADEVIPVAIPPATSRPQRSTSSTQIW